MRSLLLPLVMALGQLAGRAGLAQGPAVPPVVGRARAVALAFEAVDLHRTVDGRRVVLLRWEDGRHAEAGVGRGAIVRLEAGASPDAARLAGWSTRLVRPLMPSAGLFLVESLDDAEDGLSLARRLRPLVQAGALLDASPDLWLARRKWTADRPNDPLYPAQWFFSDLHMPDAWALTKGSATTTVVVIDDGCDMHQPDLVAKLDKGRDVIDGDDDPSYMPHSPVNYHGTACAGLVGASTDNALGVAGACPECRMRCVRLLGSETTMVPVSADVDSFQFALTVDADVVSNSWGYTEAMPAPQPLADAINEVATHGRHGKGALVFFAAGNDDRRVGDDELLGIAGVIGVGAVTHFGEKTQYSNFGKSVDLVAPTGAVTTDISGPDGANSGDEMTTFGGTSSACPVAAGIGGLLASVAPDKTAAELTAMMLETTRRAPYAEPDATGHDDFYGRGLIDPVALLERALPAAPDAGTPEPTPGSGGDAGAKGCSCGYSALGWASVLPFLARRRRQA